MQVIWVLFPLICLVALVGFVWLLKLAFSRSGMWGAVVLIFSPIGATIYAFRFWDEARKPFLIYAGSVAASFVLALVSVFLVGAAVVDAVGQELAQMELTEPTRATVAEFTIEPTPEPAPVFDLATAAAQAERELATHSLAQTLATLIEPKNDPAPSRRRNQFVSLETIGSHRGERFEVLTRDGHTFVGRYVATRAGKLLFRRLVQAGAMTLHLSPEQIESVRLLQPPRR